ncbi:substrate-binding domain-containing protein [Ruminococcus sp. OA3]|uniref:substrate-binding domain-containing protein n=1 Tax=Ruminococcus sp. OA3 TaxID=2914164 RepID=UPI001F055A4E|nr:substrate-binding domain-containing protein [Ruminococcus sp. OA3]MCH1982354.1 substrate-binding domain-containing protein [Ruminococcus sp. OA3]
MRKRVLATLLAAGMVMGSLAGCGNSDSGSSDSGSKEAETTKEAETKTDDAADDAAGDEAAASGDLAEVLGDITMVIANRDEFLSEMESGAIKAAETLGVKMTTVDAQNDQSKLLQFVETAKNNDQKVIIVNPVDAAADACQQIVDAAGDMKVVFVNRPPDDIDAGSKVLNENVVYVGSDEMTSGYFQGQALSEYFKEQGKTDIKYILIQGTLGQVSTTNRTASLLKAFEDNGINAEEATSPLVADWDRATAQDMITPLLTTIEYDCIVGNCDALSLGAIEAMKSQGLDPSSVPIVGIDATTDGRQAIHDGDMYMTVFQNAAGQGYGAMKAAANLVQGKPANDGTEWELDETGCIVWIPFEPVNLDNVDTYDNYTLNIE